MKPTLALALLLISCISPGAPLAQQPAPGPQPGQRPPSAAVVDALLETVAVGSQTAVRRFLDAHAAPAYRSIPLAEHTAEFARMHRALGRAEMRGLQLQPSGERWVTVRSAVDGESYLVRLAITEGPAPKVERVEWEREQLTGTLTGDALRQALERLYDAVERIYVMPDTARMIADHLRGREAAGAYAGISDRDSLTRALTADLQAINGDRHLYVRPATAGGPGGPGPGPGASAAATGPAAIGFTKVERLPGNIGYIELAGPLGRMGQMGSGSDDDGLVGEVVRAMEGADAVILDLRGSPGGSALLANLLVSHFLPAGVHTFTFHSRLGGGPVERRTLDEVPGPRLLDVPLYVLTSGRTFSAGEDIAFVLGSQNRATLIGEITRGGGRNNAIIQLGHGLMASISHSRVLDPRTGEEAWERVGVAPDVEVAAADALEAALRRARSISPRRASGDGARAEGRAVPVAAISGYLEYPQ
jgi:hypothetical protein